MNYYVIIIEFIIIVILLRYIAYKNKYLDNLLEAAKRIKENNYNLKFKKNQGGKYSLVGETIIDLTKAVKLEEVKNNENTSRISAILSTVPNGLLALDSDENILFINEVACRILSVCKDAKGKKLFNQLREPQLSNMIKSLLYNYKGPIRFTIDKNHYEFTVQNINSQVSDSVIGKLISISDLTGIINTENIRREFVSNVTHELKTPLTSISGFVETLKSNENIPKEMQHKFLNIIEEETQRLNELIEDVLTLSFIEQNLEMKIDRINLVKVIEDTIFKLENIAKIKNIELLLQSENNIFIQSNKSSLARIFINIIDNAIKYSEENTKIKIKIDSNSKNVKILVIDEGRGIKEEDLGRIFERFYRADKTRSKKEQGTGLGLAIVKHLTKSLKGEIEIKSEVGKGTEFCVTLPVIYEKGD